MFFSLHKTQMPNPEQALPGRDTPINVTNKHHVNHNPIVPPFDEGLELAMFGMGCFGVRSANSGKQRMSTRPL